MKESGKRRSFGTLLRADLHERLRSESLRSGRSIRVLVERALDKALPQRNAMNSKEETHVN